VIDKRYDFADIAQGHMRMEANANIGKIVIDISAN
jgi:NADPH:quinone reductase-like Zn-dependent oxidoreductase